MRSKEYLNMILQILYFLFLHLKLFQHFHPGETDQRGTGGGKKTQIGRAQTTCKFVYAILVNQSILLLNFVHLGFVKVVTGSTPDYQVLTTFLNGQAQQAQKFREQQEEVRRRHIDELRSKDMDRRAQVCQFPEIHF